jgi:acyl transferase domain-containing protein/NADPH:quinone reductase-like Zn-dependent oxidoreductase/1-acyl-sn-glycerol-3-phosphate acyltransferase/NAD(P)-dependent dehydrogenase (short-subunit alcohol dehydrogenase family)/acyl carrier protein
MNQQQGAIAIIGMGCRFPGGANSPEEFWQLLRNGVDAIRDIPADRASLLEVYDPDPAMAGRSYMRRGGFVDRIDEWDAGFFGISPREAAHIDPQHRLLLEVAWEALEDAGQSVDRLAGSRTGVFVGISTHDYGDTQCDPANRHLLDSHSNSGNATSIAANRISYLYDLRGPSLTVDTACSSSLTATHLACQSLRAGDCDVAIVGGVQLQINPELTIGFCKASMISPSGECRAFDASANGYVRSEGAGVVVLKALAAALADGDEVYAVILGSAINQDGRTNGMTVPSPIAQEAMLREALANARVSATDVHYVEAHGTGTPVGDPIEIRALGAVLREGREAGEYCAVGSVKTNIGHLEAASGIAGLIKTALCVKHRMLPASLHFTTPNPDIDFPGARLRVVTALEPWPDAPGPATAGVNSFGFGGANAHVILQESPRDGRLVALPEPAGSRATLIPLSARSAEALSALARGHMTALGGPLAAPLADIATSAAHRRAHHEHRIAVVAATREEAVDALDAALAGETRAALARGRRSEGGGKLAFVFSGMGPQWWGMGQQLRAENRVFREMLERCHEALRPHAPWALLDELARDEHASRIAEPDFAQVTNFVIQVALADVWKSWGIVPDAVVGHSAGEMAAAYVGGALTLEHAVKVCYHRSRLQSEANPGKILAVGMAPADLERMIAQYAGAIDLAAVNSPVSCTVAGEAQAVESLFSTLQREQVFARMLSFSVPYHSVRMDPIEEELTSVLSDVRPMTASIPIVSTVSGTWAEGVTFGANYWFQNVRRTVRFADGINTLLDSGHTTLLEQAPHPVLAAAIGECLAARKDKATVLASLRRKEDERAALLRSLGVLYVQGRPVDWDGVFEKRRSNVRLPSYPWQRERHWFEGSSTEDRRANGGLPQANGAPQHPPLGRRVRAAHPLWELWLGDDRLAYLDDHQIQGTVVFPGALHVAMALGASQATRAGDGDARISLRGVEFVRALFLPDRARTLVQLGLNEGGTSFQVHSSSTDADASWTLHASGQVEVTSGLAPKTESLDDIRERCATPVSQDDCYATLRQRGLEYGPAFRGIDQLWTGAGEAVGHINVPGLSTDAYQLHPALLDAAFQLLVSAAGGTRSDRLGVANDGGVFLPVFIRELTVHAPAGGSFWAHARVESFDEHMLVGDIQLMDADGLVIASALGFRCRRIAEPQRAETLDDWLYEYRWENRQLRGAAERSLVEITTADLVARVQPKADALSTESHWTEYYRLVEPRLNAIAVAFMSDAMRALGDDLAAVVPARRRLGEHVRAILAAEGATPGANTKDMARALVADFPAFATDVALLVQCGTHLSDVLTGRADGGSVLFGGDAFELLTRFYHEAPPQRYYNALAAMAIAEAGKRTTGDHDTRPLRVLEVGGGTGATTALVLPTLDAARAEYVFTDITPLFTEQAKVTFADVPFLSTGTLDIERDPVAQGYTPHSYDVILAANVLHGTPSLAESLANLKRLLAPGGALVLIEITRRPIWTDLIFGLTDGWWRFSDGDVRPSHPLLPASDWEALLAREGFDGVATIADTDREGESALAVIVARASLDASMSMDAVATVRTDDRWVIFADGGGAGRALAERLEASGLQTTIVEQGAAFMRRADGGFECRVDDAADMTMLLAALSADGQRPRGIVHCWALDTPDLDTVAPDALLGTQRTGVGSALALVQALESHGGAQPALLFVTAGAQQDGSGTERLATTQSPLWGFGRVLMKDQPDLHARLIDLGASYGSPALDALAREIASGEADAELSLRDGRRQVRRLRRVSRGDASLREPLRAVLPGAAYRAEVGTPGALESMALREVHRRAPGPGEVEVCVSAAGLNFRDVMLAMGLYPSIPGEASFSKGLLGLDFAGRVTACGDGVTSLAVGDDVVGIAAGSFSAYATTPAALVVRRPLGLSVTQGAGIPSVFITAYYALHHLARLQRGERVLIHSATGGVGLAAIQVAREVGAEIFATAGSAAKRRHLEELSVEHVMDSRSLAFADEVMQRTGGEGVDVVLNSLAGDAIARGIGVLRGYGRFIEIGKRDIFQDSRIGLLAFRKNLAFFGVDVDLLGLDRPELAQRMLSDIAERFERGTYTALPAEVFPVSRVEDALRFMAQARHIGKVVLSMDDPAIVVAPSRAGGALFRGDATYLMSGGLGGFGLAVAEWMAREGARHLVLTGRSGAIGEAEERVRALRERGVRVEVKRADIGSVEDVRRLLAEVRAEMPPLRGIVHAAMVLDDGPVVELDRERLDRVMGPKMNGAWHLHRETLGESLDCFVMFSSLASMLGSPLQANYAAANAFLDALAHHRRSLGLAALAINWGPIGEVGYVSRHRDVGDYLARLGYGPFTPAQAFDVLGTLLRREAGQLMAARIDWAQVAESSPAAAASPILRHLVPVAGEGTARRSEAGSQGGSLRAALLATPAGERRARIILFLREKVGKVIGMSPAKLDTERALTELGFDSLMAVELMTVLRVEAGVELAAVKLLQGVSISGLATLVLEQVGDAEEVTAVTALPKDTDARMAIPEEEAPVVPSPPDVAQPSSYDTIDYSRWTMGQRVVRGAVSAAMRALTSMRVEGLEHIPLTGGCLLAINHLSMADTPVVLSLLPRRTIMFASEHLRGSALMHWFLSDMGDAIYVRRGEGDRDALASGLAVLRAGGLLGLGPEGTRSPNGLSRGQTGIAFLATQADVPVVPLAAWGQELIPAHLRSLRRAPITVRIGAPLRFAAGTPDAALLREYTDQVMQSIASMLPAEYRGVYGA